MNIRRNVAAALIGLSALSAVASANAEVITRNDEVLAHQADIWTFQFDGYEPVWIALRGDGDTDLDLEVRDDNGHVIAISDGMTDHEQVGFTPAHDGTFKVRIRNLGDVYNAYDIYVRTGLDVANQRTRPNVVQTRR